MADLFLNGNTQGSLNGIFSVNTLRDILRDGGVRILKYELHYPEFTQESPFALTSISSTSVNEFCRNFAAAYETWLRGELFTRLCDEYRADPNPRKRFRNCCAEVSLDFTVTYANAESGILSMYWDICRRRGGITESFVRKSQTWSTINNTICVAHDFLRSNNTKKSDHDFYLRPGKLILYRNCFGESVHQHNFSRNYSFFIQEKSFDIKN